ncbi:hypothetical protein CRT38_01005 [Anaplasma phagocytophilum str. CRT38]|uniref:Uncharacterized protein n=1 Tax=Anaplasma phagocytophilum str. CRT38 TaxID=1269275 RepID=S6GBD7_ANAPH|nr:hypothetical protein CRT38_01005 [Anaplasma phagocytophilum str. CRT38]
MAVCGGKGSNGSSNGGTKAEVFKDFAEKTLKIRTGLRQRRKVEAKTLKGTNRNKTTTPKP